MYAKLTCWWRCCRKNFWRGCFNVCWSHYIASGDYAWERWGRWFDQKYWKLELEDRKDGQV